MKVFISHSSDDKRFVRTLKTDLNENGVNTWFDEDELNFGDSLLEKLELSIIDTSHFIIILSESSINSIWVQQELKQVIKSVEKRIIPIKYKECTVPDELSKLLFGDVSQITRIVEGDRLSFKDDKYYNFVSKLIKALKAKNSELTSSEKRSLTTSEVDIRENEPSNYLKLKVISFSSSEVRENYSSKVLNTLTASEINERKSILTKPIILPKIFNTIFKEIKLGAKITLKNKSGEQREGIFAGFRRQEDNSIVIPVSIRNFLNIEKSAEQFDIIVSEDKFEMMIL